MNACNQPMTPMKIHTEMSVHGYYEHFTAKTNSISSF